MSTIEESKFLQADYKSFRCNLHDDFVVLELFAHFCFELPPELKDINSRPAKLRSLRRICTLNLGAEVCVWQRVGIGASVPSFVLGECSHGLEAVVNGPREFSDSLIIPVGRSEQYNEKRKQERNEV